MDEMETLAKRIATGRPDFKRRAKQPNAQLSPEQSSKMKRMGSRMSDRLIGRFK